MEVRIGLNHIVPGCKDIPEGLEDYPYLAVVNNVTSYTTMRTLYASKYPMVLAKVGTSGTYQYLHGTGNGFKEYSSMGTLGWSLDEESEDAPAHGFVECEISSLGTYSIAWANHDIMVANEASNQISSSVPATASSTLYTAKGIEPKTIVVPDVSAELLGDYSHAVIVYAGDASGGMCYLMATSAPTSVARNDTAADAIIGANIPGVVMYGWQDGLTEWQFGEEITEVVTLPLGVDDGSIYALVWSNHDVFVATSANEDLSKVETSAEVYLFNSEYKETWNIGGTEIPALSPDILRKYPHAFVLQVAGEEAASFCGAVSPLYCIPADLNESGKDKIVSFENGMLMYVYMPETGSWNFFNEDATIAQEIEVGVVSDTVTRNVVWTNQDIFYATNVDDTQNPVIGTDLYRKSDDNYRVYSSWMYSMANHARRLGSISGIVKPDEMETVFKSAVSAEGMVF